MNDDDAEDDDDDDDDDKLNAYVKPGEKFGII